MERKKLTKPIFYVPLAVLCCLLWSSAFPFIKLGYRYFEIAAADTASQILFAGLRFALAGVLTLLLGSLLARKVLVPRRWRTVAHIGILSLAQTAVQYTLFYLALAKIQGSAGSVLNSAGTFFCVLLSAAVFRESDRLNGKKLIGCALGFGGIIIVNLSAFRVGFHFSGEGLMLLSALCYAVSSILIKKFSREEHPALLSGWQFLLGGVLMCALGYFGGGRLQAVGARAVAVVVYLALVSAVAYTLWGILLKYNAVSEIAVFGFLIPVGGVLLSALILKEQIAPLPSALCLLMVSAGIVLVNVKHSSYIRTRLKSDI